MQTIIEVLSVCASFCQNFSTRTVLHFPVSQMNNSVRPHDAGKAAQHRIQFSDSASDRRYKEQQTKSVEQTAIDREMGEGRREVRRKLNKHLHDNTLLSASSSADRATITANEHTIPGTAARRNLHNDGPYNSYRLSSIGLGNVQFKQKVSTRFIQQEARIAQSVQ